MGSGAWFLIGHTLAWNLYSAEKFLSSLADKRWTQEFTSRHFNRSKATFKAECQMNGAAGIGLRVFIRTWHGGNPILLQRCSEILQVGQRHNGQISCRSCIFLHKHYLQPAQMRLWVTGWCEKATATEQNV